jgi:S-adenosylmethionine synthetase
MFGGRAPNIVASSSVLTPVNLLCSFKAFNAVSNSESPVDALATDEAYDEIDPSLRALGCTRDCLVGELLAVIIYDVISSMSSALDFFGSGTAFKNAITSSPVTFFSHVCAFRKAWTML